MKYIISISLLFLFLTSCGKPYMFEKMVVNNTNDTITVTNKSCQCLDEPHVIPPRTIDTLMICGWASYEKPPTSAEVENKYQIISDRPTSKRIEEASNWETKTVGKKITLTFTLNAEDLP